MLIKKLNFCFSELVAFYRNTYVTLCTFYIQLKRYKLRHKLQGKKSITVKNLEALNGCVLDIGYLGWCGVFHVPITCDIVLLFFSCFSAGLPLQGTLLEKKSYLLNLLLRFPFLFLIEKN